MYYIQFIGKKKGINDAVTYLPLDQQKIWANVIKDWPNSRAKDITKLLLPYEPTQIINALAIFKDNFPDFKSDSSSATI